MNVQEALEFLREKVKEVAKLEKLRHSSQEVLLWRNSIEYILEDVFGRDSLEYTRFYGTRAKWAKLTEAQKQRKYLRQLKRRKTEILSIIRKYETIGFEARPTTAVELQLKAFIAHEGETQALTKLREFLEALGVKYFIAEAEASGGKSVEKHVNWVEEQGDFAIILATKGKAVDKKTGRHYMGLNVADELGSARQIYGNHIILLVQKGVQVHTNKREIVYGEFTSTNMQEAFIKIVRELKNWGFIRAETKQGI